MLRYAQWALIPAVLFGWLLAAGPATAQKKRTPPRTVQDEAGLFSPSAVEKANAEIADIKRLYDKDLLIETFARARAGIDKVDLTNPAAKRKFFVDWAIDRAKNSQVNGVYVLICKEPPYVRTVEGQKTRESGMFTNENADVLAKRIIADLRANKADKALLDGVKYVRDTFRAQAPTAARAPTAAPVPPKANVPAPVHRGQMGNDDGHSNILGWVCVALVAVLVIWLIFGLIRAFTAPRGGYMGGPGGGAGYGGGGYGGGGGGFGGGGFMSGLLGGMFGAVAGNWLYNSFGGGHQSGGGWGASSAQAADPGQPDAGTDVGGDYSAGGGGDYGDAGGDQGGGDAGGGGGDWGGGGGGDAGGGGGDWGGGGGGDAGGGGGDWGGGGGGGDFGGGGGDFGGGGGGGGDW